MNDFLEKEIARAIVESGVEVKAYLDKEELTIIGMENFKKFISALGVESFEDHGDGKIAVKEILNEYWGIPFKRLDKDSWLMAAPEKVRSMTRVFSQKDALMEDENSIFIDDFPSFMEEVERIDPQAYVCLRPVDDSKFHFMSEINAMKKEEAQVVVGWDDAEEEIHSIKCDVYIDSNGKAFAPEEELDEIYY